MPRVSDALNAAAASSASSASPADDRAAAAAAAADAAAPPACSVCLDDLSKRRELRVQPCGHLFHRSCLLHWLESRESINFQLCPNCRQEVDAVKNHHGVDHPLSVDCLGSTGKPTKNQVIKNSLVRRLNLGRYLEAQIEKITSACANAQNDRFADTDKCETWLDDCKEELEKLEERKRIYREMHEVYGLGGMRQSDEVFTEWNYREELINLQSKQLQNHTREQPQQPQQPLSSQMTVAEHLQHLQHHQQIQLLQQQRPQPPQQQPRSSPRLRAAANLRELQQMQQLQQLLQQRQIQLLQQQHNPQPGEPHQLQAQQPGLPPHIQAQLHHSATLAANRAAAAQQQEQQQLMRQQLMTMTRQTRETERAADAADAAAGAAAAEAPRSIAEVLRLANARAAVTGYPPAPAAGTRRRPATDNVSLEVRDATAAAYPPSPRASSTRRRPATDTDAAASVQPKRSRRGN